MLAELNTIFESMIQAAKDILTADEVEAMYTLRSTIQEEYKDGLTASIKAQIQNFMLPDALASYKTQMLALFGEVQ